MEGIGLEAIASFNATRLCAYYGFDRLLPVGRLNGFINMIDLIKKLANQVITSTDVKQAVRDHFAHADLTSDTSAYTTSTSTGIDPRQDEVAVLLSGGVDSSVALQLLLLQGYKVRAYYLKIWLEDEVAHLNSCPWEGNYHTTPQHHIPTKPIRTIMPLRPFL